MPNACVLTARCSKLREEREKRFRRLGGLAEDKSMRTCKRKCHTIHGIHTRGARRINVPRGACSLRSDQQPSVWRTDVALQQRKVVELKVLWYLFSNKETRRHERMSVRAAFRIQPIQSQVGKTREIKYLIGRVHLGNIICKVRVKQIKRICIIVVSDIMQKVIEPHVETWFLVALDVGHPEQRVAILMPKNEKETACMLMFQANSSQR